MIKWIVYSHVAQTGLPCQKNKNPRNPLISSTHSSCWRLEQDFGVHRVCACVWRVVTLFCSQHKSAILCGNCATCSLICTWQTKKFIMLFVWFFIHAWFHYPTRPLSVGSDSMFQECASNLNVAILASEHIWSEVRMPNVPQISAWETHITAWRCLSACLFLCDYLLI